MLYTGLYINLDSSRDRRKRMEAELSSFGLTDKYQRFEAIRGDGTKEQSQTALPGGQLGCWLSHLAVWRLAAGKGSHLHVLEDDAALSPLLRARRGIHRIGCEERLTYREEQIARLVRDGRSNKEIARDLALGQPTIKTHLMRMYRKLGVSNRTELVGALFL